jgi:hypothetical protein
MRLLKRIKAKLLRQYPMEHDDILQTYMSAASAVKPGPLFATDFVRLVEAHHGIVPEYKVELLKYDI